MKTKIWVWKQLLNIDTVESLTTLKKKRSAADKLAWRQ